MIEHKKFSSLDDIDFDALFNASLSRMDAGTYVWQKPNMSVAEKRDAIFSHASNVMSQANSFCFTGIIDGIVVTAIFGTQCGPILYGAITVAGPDGNGSRAYAYNQDVIDNCTTFLRENGIQEFKGFMPKNSPLRATQAIRHSEVDQNYSDYEYTDKTDCEIFTVSSPKNS